MKKYQLYIIIAFVLALIVYSLIYLLTPLKIVDYNPKNKDKFIGIDTPINIQFNKNLLLSNLSVKLSPEVPLNIKKEKNTLNISLIENLKTNQEYSVILSSKNKFADLSGQKSTLFSWTFITAGGLTEEITDTNLEDYYNQFPLTKFTPYTSEHFSIDWPNDQSITIITLYAVFNASVSGPPIEVQKAAYIQQLKDYKKEALDWIKSKGIDPNSIKIQWLPEEAVQY